MQAINNIATLTMANIQTQNDALQTNNQANAQILQTLERNQNTTQTLTQEIARLNGIIVNLQNQLATNAQAHQVQIEALTTQLGALQQLVARLERDLTLAREDHRDHVHIVDRGTVYNPPDHPGTYNNYPIKVTEKVPRNKKESPFYNFCSQQ